MTICHWQKEEILTAMSHIRIRSKTTSTWVTVQPFVSWQQHNVVKCEFYDDYEDIWDNFNIVVSVVIGDELEDNSWPEDRGSLP